MWERYGSDGPLARFLVLSMLLHVLAILLFGAPTGGSREGRALWGSSSLDVVIRDPFKGTEPAPALRFDRGLGSLNPSPRSPAPGAVETAPQPAPIAEPPNVEPEAAAAKPPVPRVLERIERKPETPPFEVPKPSENQEATRVERALPEPPKIEAPHPAPKPIEVPRIEVPVAPRIERQMAEPPKVEAPPPPPKPIEVPRIDAPVLPRVDRQLAEPPKLELPAPAPRPIEVPRIEAPVVPRIERQLAEPPKIEAPIVQPVTPIEVPRLDRMPTPRVERQLAEPPKLEAPPVAPPVETPPVPSPSVEKPAASAPPVERAPAEVQRVPATRVEPSPAPKVERPAAPATPSTQQAAPPTPVPAERTPPGAPQQTAPALPRESAPLDVAPSPFRTSPAQPSKDYDPTAPSLDVDTLRKRAGDITRAGTGNRALLAFPMPPVDKPKTKMEDAIEKARKPDCRTAYKDLGLAAVVPLIANEFGEGTCRW
jgi:hypothetical protein